MLDITLVQTELDWEDPAANRARFDTRLANIAVTDLIVLPEMFTTGFSMNSAALGEPAGGDTLDWMRGHARAHDAFICGSVMTRDGTERYNRFYLVAPDGSVDHYDKRHLFRMGEENDNYSPGRERKVMRIGDMTLLPQVCYDLRFPVFSRNDLHDDAGYDLIIYVANWPAPRREHWQTLLRARAIENLSYVVGLNRIGSDERGIDYAGDSTIIDFRGDPIVALGDEEAVVSGKIDRDALSEHREQFPAWKDADPFTLG